MAIKNLIKESTFSPFIGIELDKTNTSTLSTYNEKRIENFGLNIDSTLISDIKNTSNFEKSIHKIYFIDNKQFISPYYNYNSFTQISPFEWLNTNININHEESISPIPGIEDKVEDRQGYNIVRIVNDAFLEYSNVPDFIYKQFKNSYSSLGI